MTWNPFASFAKRLDGLRMDRAEDGDDAALECAAVFQQLLDFVVKAHADQHYVAFPR